MEIVVNVCSTLVCKESKVSCQPLKRLDFGSRTSATPIF